MDLTEEVKKALEKYPDKVSEYKNGKITLLGLFVGEVILQTKGTCDPKEAVRLVKEALDTKKD
jgi:aspartyl-tRNA(Asn)/glutamyl-tRNA(Gln) amidotransferase subunit B